jgi:MFS family permease
MAPGPVGYIELLRSNKPFRRLWYGQIVSQLGDWFASIALFTVLLKLTGSGQAVGLLLVAEFLPGALIGPFAGVIVDRLPRKLVLIATDIGRAVLVLGLLFVQGADQIWLIYLIVALKVVLTAFFEPARSALIPNLCRREELVAANGIAGATWSAMLAIGAALGGLVVGTLGIQAAFLIDAATFLLSAVLIATVQVEERPARGEALRTQNVEPSNAEHRAQSREQRTENAEPRTQSREPPGRAATRGNAGGVLAMLGELGVGLHYIVGHRDIFWCTFTKALWSSSGGVLLLLTLYGRELFPLGRDGAISIGLLYAARGLGAAIGPIVAQRLGGNEPNFLRRMIGVSFFLSAAGYLAFSGAPSLLFAMLAVMLAHTGGSIEWVFSTSLLQMHVPDQLRGRVFAVEYAALTLTTATSSYLTGVASDAGIPPRTLAASLGSLYLIPGALLLLVLWKPLAGEASKVRSQKSGALNADS